MAGDFALEEEPARAGDAGEDDDDGASVEAAHYESPLQVDPRPFLVGELQETFRKYPDLGALLPAMGYGDQQVADLEATLRRAAEGGVEAVAIGTPIDLQRLVDIPVPSTRVRYELQVLGQPDLGDALAPIMEKAGAKAKGRGAAD